jgi:glycosyltransferase involved in cell wall biosynthesis
MKPLIIVNAKMGRLTRGEQVRLEEADQAPRVSLFERMTGADVLDEHFMRRVPRLRRWLYRAVPLEVAQVIEAFLVQRRYDVIISWTDKHTMLLCILFKLLGKRIPFVALMFWISKPKKVAILKRTHSAIDSMIFWSSRQREFAVRTMGVPEAKTHLIRYFVDQQFYRPMGRTPDMISSVGIEMRDYQTLLEALKGVDTPCRIVAGNMRGTRFPSVKVIEESGPLPRHITVGMCRPLELREIYARSHFVVIPLFPTINDHGLTVILEAMAMGKAVICSRTEGQVDVIQEGVTGIFVPPGDPKALREGIAHLLNNPALAVAMGMAARKYVEKNNTLEAFVETVKSIAEDTISERRPPGPHSGTGTISPSRTL